MFAISVVWRRPGFLNECLAAVMLLAATQAFGQGTEPLPPIDVSKAQALYSQCSACHGNDGRGNASLQAPALAGQYAWYISRQLQHFRTNIRIAPAMNSLAATLSEADIGVLASYLAAMPVMSVVTDITGDLKNGSRYYQAKCGACHGGKGEGNVAFNAPRLAGQHSDYLNRQLDNFRTGKRGTHAEDKFGRQMAMMAKAVNGKDWQDIRFYLAKQSGQ